MLPLRSIHGNNDTILISNRHKQMGRQVSRGSVYGLFYGHSVSVALQDIRNGEQIHKESVRRGKFTERRDNNVEHLINSFYAVRLSGFLGKNSFKIYISLLQLYFVRLSDFFGKNSFLIYISFTAMLCPIVWLFG